VTQLRGVPLRTNVQYEQKQELKRRKFEGK
jgi:hypothetical protein